MDNFEDIINKNLGAVSAPSAPEAKKSKEDECFGIGLRDYATIIGGIHVSVESGQPWRGQRLHYDILKRAKVIK